MPALSQLFVEFRASTDKFNSDVRSAQREVREFEKTIKPSIDVLKAFGVAAAGASAIIVGASAAMFAFAKTAADFGDKIRDASIQTGLGTETLSGLKTMAEQSGASFEDLNTGLKFLAKNFIAATEGGKEQQAAFAKLGIGLNDLKAANGNLEPVMRMVMDQLKAMPDGANKAAIELALLGKNGVALTETLSQGSAALDNYIGLTKLLGTSVTPEAAAAADAFNDSLNLLDQAAQGFTITIGNELTPALSEVVAITTAAVVTAKDYAVQLIDMARQAGLVAKALWGSDSSLGSAFAGILSVVPGANLIVADIAVNYAKLRVAIDQTAESEKAAASLRQMILDAQGQTTEALKKRAEAAKEAAAAHEKLQRITLSEVNALGRLASSRSDPFEAFMEGQEARAKELRDAARALGDMSLDPQIKDLKKIVLLQGDVYGNYKKGEEDRADQFKDATELIIATQDKAQEAARRQAESYQRIWEQATANVASDFVKGFSDVIFHAKNFGQALKDIALNAAESMFKAFMTGLFSPLTSAMSSLGRKLADVLTGGIGGNGGLLGKGLGALGGILGIHGTAAAAAGFAPSIAGGIGTASIIGVTSGAGGAAAAVPAAVAPGAHLGASMAAFATNPITLAVAGAIAAGLAIHHFVGRGRRSANEFVQGAENPFRNSLSSIVDSFDSMKKAGSLTLEQAQKARDSAQELWRSFLQSNAQFAAQGKTQAKVAEQSLDHLRELFGPNLSKVFEGMDTTIAGLKGQGGSGIPSTGLAQSASTRFAAAVDKLIPAFDSLVAAVAGVGPGGTSLTITNDFAPVFTFYGVPESLQQQIREQIEPQLISDLSDNTRGITEKVKSILGL